MVYTALQYVNTDNTHTHFKLVLENKHCVRLIAKKVKHGETLAKKTID